MSAEASQIAPLAASAPPRLDTSLCIGWGVGSLGMSLMFSATGVLMLRYLVDYAGVAAGVAGLLIGLSKFYDALVDPLVGVASDRTRSRWGRRRPYLLWGGLLSAASFVTIFHLDGVEPSMKVAVALVVLLLNASGYALFNVPYLAMPGEMTDDYHERTRLMSFRVAAVATGQLLASSLGPVLIVRLGGGAVGHERTAWLLAGSIVLASVACFLGTRAAPSRPVPHRSFGLFDQARAAWSNRPFVLLLGIKLTYLLGLSIFMAVLPFLFTWVMRVSYEYLGLYFLLQSSAMLVSQPLWVRFTRGVGKKRAYVVGSVVTALSLGSWLLAGAGEPAWAIMLRGAVYGVGGGGLMLIGQSMLPDVMAHDARLTGTRREGLLAGIYTTVEKLSFSVGPALVGGVLGATGYVAAAGGDAIQPASALRAMYACIAVLPVLSILAGCLLLRGYRLDERALGRA
jgi:GPH family glycoside/pentoside/hexuronide:cation symporter